MGELAAAGLTVADLTDEVEVWEENTEAFSLFAFLCTQWRVGMAGPTGLDYNVMFHKLDRMGLSPEAYAQMESDIQVMEREALSTMQSKAKE